MTELFVLHTDKAVMVLAQRI